MLVAREVPSHGEIRVAPGVEVARAQVVVEVAHGPGRIAALDVGKGDGLGELLHEGDVLEGDRAADRAHGVHAHVGIAGQDLATVKEEGTAARPPAGTGVGHAFGAVAVRGVLAGGPPGKELGSEQVEPGVLGAEVDEPATALALGPIGLGAGTVHHIGIELHGIERGDFKDAPDPIVGILVVLPLVRAHERAGREQVLGEGGLGERGGVRGVIPGAVAGHAENAPRGGLEPLDGDGQGQKIEIQFVIGLGGARIVGPVGVDHAGEAGHHFERIRDELGLDDKAGRRVVENEAAAINGTLGQGQILETGGDLHVFQARPLELQVGLVHQDARGIGIGRGVGTGPPGVVDLDAQAELDGLVGHEIGPHPQTLPDLEGVLGLGAGFGPGGGIGGPGSVVPAGEVVAGKIDAIDTGVTGHLHFGCGPGGPGRDRQAHDQCGKHCQTFHNTFLRKMIHGLRVCVLARNANRP